MSGSGLDNLSFEELKDRMEPKYTYYDLAEAYCEGAQASLGAVHLAMYGKGPNPDQVRKAFDKWLRWRTTEQKEKMP